MEGLGPAPRALCRADDVPEGGSKGFRGPPGSFVGLFAVRRDGQIFVYVNSCPHLGVALNWTPDRFLTADGQFIICSTHGAEFEIGDGLCVRGPCRGDRLEAVLIEINDGVVWVPADAGL